MSHSMTCSSGPQPPYCCAMSCRSWRIGFVYSIAELQKAGSELLAAGGGHSELWKVFLKKAVTTVCLTQCNQSHLVRDVWCPDDVCPPYWLCTKDWLRQGDFVPSTSSGLSLPKQGLNKLLRIAAEDCSFEKGCVYPGHLSVTSVSFLRLPGSGSLRS